MAWGTRHSQVHPHNLADHYGKGTNNSAIYVPTVIWHLSLGPSESCYNSWGFA